MSTKDKKLRLPVTLGTESLLLPRLDGETGHLKSVRRLACANSARIHLQKIVKGAGYKLICNGRGACAAVRIWSESGAFVSWLPWTGRVSAKLSLKDRVLYRTRVDGIDQLLFVLLWWDRELKKPPAEQPT